MSATFTVKCGSATVTVEKLDWDSRLLGLHAARVTEIQGSGSPPDFTALNLKLKELGFQYVTARRPQEESLNIIALEAAGFQLLDGIISFRRSVATCEEPPGEFRLAVAADADAVAELASSTFTRSRFHTDPRISKETAERVHAEWARNSCLGTAADAVWIIDVRNSLAGFCTCKIADKTGSIVLIAVDKMHAGHGLGAQLTAKACAWFKEKGAIQAEVQTQTSNMAAMTLYAAAGFKPHASSFTLRWFSN